MIEFICYMITLTWSIFGIVRYIGDNRVNDNLLVYDMITVIVHGPVWWVLYVAMWCIKRGNKIDDAWKHVNKVFKLKEKV